MSDWEIVKEVFNTKEGKRDMIIAISVMILQIILVVGFPDLPYLMFISIACFAFVMLFLGDFSSRCTQIANMVDRDQREQKQIQMHGKKK